MVSVAPVTNELNTPEQETKSHSLTRRLLGVAAGLSLVAAIGVGCSSSGDSTSSGDNSSDTTAAAADEGATDEGGTESNGDCVSVTDGKITITTTDFDFDPDCIDLEGDSLDITYENNEEGVKHDIDFKELDKMTDLKEGPNTQELKLTGLESGKTYDWVCSIHAQMKGELNVK